MKTLRVVDIWVSETPMVLAFWRLMVTRSWGRCGEAGEEAGEAEAWVLAAGSDDGVGDAVEVGERVSAESWRMNWKPPNDPRPCTQEARTLPPSRRDHEEPWSEAGDDFGGGVAFAEALSEA